MRCSAHRQNPCSRRLIAVLEFAESCPRLRHHLPVEPGGRQAYLSGRCHLVHTGAAYLVQWQIRAAALLLLLTITARAQNVQPGGASSPAKLTGFTYLTDLPEPADLRVPNNVDGSEALAVQLAPSQVPSTQASSTQDAPIQAETGQAAPGQTQPTQPPSTQGSPAPTSPGQTPPGQGPTAQKPPVEVPPLPSNDVSYKWLDRTRQVLYESMWHSAEHVDRWFGSVRDDSVYQQIYGSIAPALLYSQYDHLRAQLRFNMNIPLPQINDRFHAFIGRFDPNEFVTERDEPSGAFARTYGPQTQDQ